MNEIAVVGASVFLILLAPLAVGSAVFLWRLYGEDIRDEPHPKLRLSLVLAITGTVAAAAGSYLAIVAALRITGRVDVVTALTPVTLIALAALDSIPIMNAVYLRWLRRRRYRVEGVRRPPPWQRGD